MPQIEEPTWENSTDVPKWEDSKDETPTWDNSKPVETVRETPWRAPALVPTLTDIQAANEISKVPGYVANVARAIPADVAAGLSMFKRPPNQPSTLFPSPTAIAGAVRQNLPAAAEASGNIPAAISGEPMPIDAILSAASKEDKTAATIGKISQGLAATAPMAAIGALPAAAQKLALIGFTAKMMADAPKLATELGDELGKPEDQRDPDKLTSLISDAVQTVGFSALGATHLVKSGLKTVNDYAKDYAPRGQGINFDIEAFNAANQPKESNALSQQEATPGDGNRGTPPLETLPPQQGVVENVTQPTPRLRVNEGEVPGVPAPEGALRRGEVSAANAPEEVAPTFTPPSAQADLGAGAATTPVSEPLKVTAPEGKIYGGGEIMEQSQWTDELGRKIKNRAPKFAGKGGRGINIEKSRAAIARNDKPIYEANQKGWQDYFEKELGSGKPVRNEWIRSWANSVGAERAKPMLEKYGYDTSSKPWNGPEDPGEILSPKPPSSEKPSEPIPALEESDSPITKRDNSLDFNIGPVKHGTGDMGFTEFSSEKLGSHTGAPSAKQGFFFAGKESTANTYRPGSAMTEKEVRKWRSPDELSKDPLAQPVLDNALKYGVAPKWYEKEMGVSHQEGDAIKTTLKQLLKDNPKGGNVEFSKRRVEALKQVQELEYGDVDFINRPLGGRVITASLSLKNPLVVDYKGGGRFRSFNQVLREARRKGNDGAIFKNVRDGGPVDTIYVVFDPSQIRIKNPPSPESKATIPAPEKPLDSPLGDSPALPVANAKSQVITEQTQRISEIQRELSEVDKETRRIVKEDKARGDAAYESGGEYAPSKSLKELDRRKASLESELAPLLEKEREDRITRKSAAEVSSLKNITGSDWADATDSVKSLPPETGPVGKPPEFPKIEPQELGAGISLPQWKLRKMTPLDVATASHSAKMQRSESNARRAVKEIRKVAKNENRQAAIAIAVEAGGDLTTLKGWAAAARGKKFKQAAIDAQTFTPEEMALASKIIKAFDFLYKRGSAHDVITNFRDNYITHIWERPGKRFGFGSGTLKQNFKFNKARTFNTFFEGDQAGFIPKTLALDRIVPAYIKEMDSVIAARQFVKDMAGQLGSDGRPLVIPRGNAKEITGSSGTATLVFPKALKKIRDAVGNKVDQSDYKTMENQPALQKWSWVAEDQAGNPIMLQADLSLHPEARKRINSMLGTSAIRDWYSEPSTGTAKIPRVIVKALDAAQSEMKKSMFGLLAPFHQVQEGWHGIGHTVNPTFGIPKIDLRDPAQLDAAAHGLMLLPDKASASSYLEGSGSQSSLLVRGLKKVPALRAIGEVSEMYQDYLFHQYIPGLKFKTYEHILDRNTKRFATELASGEVTLKDVKLLSAEQSNAAYGHLNYALLNRNPTIQHLIRMAALAPDFLEARGRFTAQAIKGLSSKVGQEQLRAIAFLAATQAGSAFVISQLLGTPYDPKHPFEVVYKGRRYTFRSVPEDIFSAVKDTRAFAYSRMNPLIAKGAIQYSYGLNYRGEKVSALETTEELLAGYIPIITRSLPGLRELTETSRRSPVTPLQQLSGSLGMRISRFSPISETYSLANDWKDEQKLPKDKGSYPVSKYQQLRYALEDGDLERAAQNYAELRKTMTPDKITSGFAESVNHPFTGSTENDRRFRASLTGYDKEMFDLAVRTRANILNAYRYMPKTAPNNMARLLTFTEHAEFSCSLASGYTAKLTARINDVLVIELAHPTGPIWVTGLLAEAIDRCGEIGAESF